MPKKRLFQNVIIGVFSKIVIILLGIVIPRIIMINYGSDTNGLIITITQIFTYIALLQSGIGQAAQNELYPYIEKKDRYGISKIVSIARRYYRKISLVYAFFVMVISIVIPIIIKTNVNYQTIFLYCLFEGLTTLVAFYFTSTWIFFLNANGKTYFTNLISLLNVILCYGIKILLVCLRFNIALIQVGYFFASLIILLIYSIYMKKNYCWIDYNAADKKEKLKDRNSYVLTEVAGVVFNSTDMIILSIFFSAALSSVYSTYNMVFVALTSLIDSAYMSIKYLLGQSYNADIQTYIKCHDAFNSIFVGITTVFMCVSYILIIPFVSLYTKGVNDINYIYRWLPLMFCLIQILDRIRIVSGNLTGLAGYAKKVSKISLVEATLNVVLSFIFVHSWGINGVLLATLSVLPIKVLYVNYLSDIVILHRSIKKTLEIYGANFLIFAITVFIAQYIKIEISSYFSFFACGILLTVIFTFISTLLNCFVNKDLTKFWIDKLFITRLR